MAAGSTCLALAACGSSADEEEVASGTFADAESGQSADYQLTSRKDGSGGALRLQTEDGEMLFGAGSDAAKMPNGFTLFPGSQIIGGMQMKGDDGQNFVVQFEVTAHLEVVAHYFETQMQKNEMTIIAKADQGNSLMIMAEKATGPIRNVMVTASDEGQKISGSFTYTQK